MAKSSSSPLSLPVILLVLVPVVAISIHRFLFAGVDVPPSDFGSGSMFDMIATRYDMINRVLAVGMDIGWRKRMVEAIHESVGDAAAPKILDVATGTADVSLLLAKQMPTATIIGVDPSNNMLEIGRQKVKQQGLAQQIDLQLHDAQDFSNLSENYFDAATMAFGIRNVPDREKALCEIHRVLKDKSRFCILEFSEPDDSFGILGKVARMFIRYIVPLMGGILSGKPREYWHLQNSIKDFPGPQQFGELMEGIGCRTGSFQLEDLIQLNFGSVQLYVTRTVRKENELDTEKQK